ncbi:MAG: hypothetical protein APR53_09655 [Methanoculleus sp. SDB]|nr:MAG: hypothetical protein APR53_09655 [Methanoculleus sp. SDB]
MELNLYLGSEELSDNQLQKLTRDLSKDLARESSIEATIPERPAEKGMKGDPITLGLLALTLLSSGTVVALFNVLKSYFERDSTLEITIENHEGNKYSFKAQNMRPDQIEMTMNEVINYFGI